MQLLRKIYETAQQVELTEKPTSTEVTQAWPNGVTYRGFNVYNKVYNTSAVEMLERMLQRENDVEGFDFQESYLGYIPSEDRFVMGWDTWADGDETSNVIGFKMVPAGDDLRLADASVVGVQGRMMYGRGGAHDDLEAQYKDLIDVRLD